MLGGAVATLVAPTGPHPYSLLVGGQEVLTGAAGFGVSIDTILVDEKGPGGVSSMRLTVGDPAGVWAPLAGAEVLYIDNADGHTIFRGSLDPVENAPAYGVGRDVAITATGPEAWLDWIKLRPAYTVPPAAGSTSLPNLAGSIVYMVTQQPGHPLRASGGITTNGSATDPVGLMDKSIDGLAAQIPFSQLTSYAAQSGTLREGIRYLMSVAVWLGLLGGKLGVGDQLFTVDMDNNVRVWLNDPAAQPSDYTTLVVTDAVGGALVASNLRYTLVYGDVPHAVYIEGGNAAGSGWFGDGSGITSGPRDIVTDSTILTAVDAQAAASAYFAANGIAVRGSFELLDFSPAATVHAGSLLTLTDTQTGATGSYRILGITKRFHKSGRQSWVVSFGGLAPSMTALARKLTRATLS